MQMQKKRRDILEGIAFEYGGYFLTKEKKVFQLCFSRNNDSDTKNIISLSKEYGCSPINGYKSVLSFEMQNPTQNHINFIKNVKKVVKNSKLVEFNDKYGYGIDIVPKELSKTNFVENFLKEFMVQLPEGTTYEVKTNANYINVDIMNKNLGYLIGYRGETLYALQSILSSVASKTK